MPFTTLALGPRDWLEDTDVGRYDGITMLQESEFNALKANGPRTKTVNVQCALTDWFKVQNNSHSLKRLRSKSYLKQHRTCTVVTLTRLEEVIAHYSTLEESALQGHSDEVLAPLNWTDAEIDAMIAFLHLLDDSQ